MQAASLSFSFLATGSERLDVAIATGNEAVSRRLARRLIEEHRVTVNGRLVSVASRSVNQGDRISVISDAPEVTVIGTNESWIAVDKPSGLATQPSAQQSLPSLLEILASRLKRSGSRPDLFVVHRLDTGTSGVVLFARTRDGASRLSELFAGGEIEKVYCAVVEGTVDVAQEITLSIVRVGPARYGVGDGGRAARTLVTPLTPGPATSLVEVKIASGRTHQIRVHLAAIGHPVAGDRKYGSGAPAARLMLHARKLAHPSIGEQIAEIPEVFRMA